MWEIGDCPDNIKATGWCGSATEKSQSEVGRTIFSRANSSARASTIVDLPALFAPRRTACFGNTTVPLRIPLKFRSSIWQMRISSCLFLVREEYQRFDRQTSCRESVPLGFHSANLISV